MSAREFSRKKSSPKKPEIPTYLIVYEGKFNKTESNYFTQLNRICRYVRIVPFSTEKTDPIGLMEAIEKKWSSLGLNKGDGDRAFIVLDLDVNQDKAELISEIQSQSHNAEFIVSNPCIEVWFLNHFPYSTKSFSSSKETKKELKRKIPKYSENYPIFDLLLPNMQDAINNSCKQIEFGDSCGYSWPSSEFNPRTDMCYLVSLATNNIIL